MESVFQVCDPIFSVNDFEGSVKQELITNSYLKFKNSIKLTQILIALQNNSGLASEHSFIIHEGLQF